MPTNHNNSHNQGRVRHWKEVPPVEFEALSPQEQAEILATADILESHKSLPLADQHAFLHLGEALKDWGKAASKDPRVRGRTWEEVRADMELEAEADPEFREWLIMMNQDTQDEPR
jgi:hypothetical protein